MLKASGSNVTTNPATVPAGLMAAYACASSWSFSSDGTLDRG
jgi:hypothetical protein